MNLLIDGSSLLWRTHYANKSQNNIGDSFNIYVFLKSLKSYVEMYNSKDIYIAWDKKLCKEKNFRQELEDCDYKGNRDGDKAIQVYGAQPLIHKATELIGCRNFYPWIMEADDIIAWLSKNLHGSNIIITTDGDMLQLINEKTCVFNPRKKIVIDKNNFESTMEMPIEHFLPYKAILGDTSDNIKGINGYGKVYSKRLAKKWVDKADDIKPEHKEIIEKNIKMMDLSNGYKMAGKKEELAYEMQLERFKNLDADLIKFEDFCKEHDFKSILRDIDKWKRAFEKPKLFKLLENMTF